jgi:hypothetical protein
MTEKTHKVAVLAFRSTGVLNSYDDYETLNLPVHCTEWVELTAQEAIDLENSVRYLNYNNGKKKDYAAHIVLYQPKIDNDSDQKSYILEKIADYKEYLKKEKEKEEKRKADEEAKKLQRKLNKEAKTIEDKKKLLESLKQELGEA